MKVFLLWVIFSGPDGIITDTEALEGHSYYGEIGLRKCVADGEKAIKDLSSKDNDVSYVCMELGNQAKNINTASDIDL